MRGRCIISPDQLKKFVKDVDSASGIVFFIGAILLKIQQILPTPIAAVITNSVALGFYVVGYGLWLIESIIYPNRVQNQKEWYGFASLKEQFTAASVIGLIATALSVATIFFPILIIPACWLFSISNFFWLVGEYQKTENPPDPNEDPTYQSAKQHIYFHYVMIVSLVSFATALITTITIFFPPFLWVALFVGPLLGGMVIKAWIDAHLCLPHSTVHVKTATSYGTMNAVMPPKTLDNNTNTEEVCANPRGSVLSPKDTNTPANEEENDDTSSPIRTSDIFHSL